MIKLAVTGSCGRMGQRIVTLSQQQENTPFQLTAALEHKQHPQIGQPIGSVIGLNDLTTPVTVDLPETPDVMIDFTVPESTIAWLETCRKNPFPMVIGTTGLDDSVIDQVKEISKDVPMLVAANMSLGVNLILNLVAQVAAILDDQYDIEITETHHRFKRDAPSGTALALAKRIAQAKQWPYPDCLDISRNGKDALRQDKTIGMAVMRMGSIIGDHTVNFTSLAETIEVRHTAHTRDTFVRGALHAAQWLVQQKPGLYDMADVLGL